MRSFNCKFLPSLNKIKGEISIRLCVKFDHDMLMTN